MTRQARLVRRGVAVARALALSALALALPAQATVIFHEQFDDTFSEDFEECGMSLRSDLAFQGVTHLRVGNGDLESAFLLQLRIDVTETITNRANGKHFSIENHSVVKDVKATRVEGTVFEFTRLEAGQAFTVRDMNGNEVLRESGSIWFKSLFDTLGDETPGGEVVTDFEPVRVNGPHPGFFLDEDQWCALMEDLIG